MNCIFGIFDVLGFTSFCENCEPDDAEKVLHIIDDFEIDIPRTLCKHLIGSNPVPQEKMNQVSSRLHWLTFSDTVFVAMPIESSDHSETLRFNLILFMVLAAFINRRMFEIGLPVRGAVHIGEVTLSRKCFAGKAIVDAYRLGKGFQVAATLVSDEAAKFVFESFPTASGFYNLFQILIMECDVSVGGNELRRAKTLCWLFLEMVGADRFNVHRDLERFIKEKFTAHGKKISGDKERRKAINTEKLFKEWIIAHVGYSQKIMSQLSAKGTFIPPTSHSP